METLKQIVWVTSDEWKAKERRNQVAMIDNRPYILFADNGAPVYQPVVIVGPGASR